ncbi:response regulator transcription factor [Gallaecimonas sp. GXIMD4217]|uniref:response regulator transcription factor n=1 Tax=Gallaecimonas sp. GXIMD4217 TaxID=3131927 RepID=UPI00311B40F5
MRKHILLLEDDVELARLIKEFLIQEGYAVTACNNASRAQLLLTQQPFDLLLCDVMLPGENGFDFVAGIRDRFQGPILFMTAQTQLHHQLHGFALGAQDYLVKPVDPRILCAKIRVFLPLEKATKTEHQGQYRLFNLLLDEDRASVRLDGQVLPLTNAEFKLLCALVAHYGSVVSREWLFQQHLGREYDGIDRTMDGRASRLRKKLQARDPHWNVVTAWGEGYRLCYDKDDDD